MHHADTMIGHAEARAETAGGWGGVEASKQTGLPDVWDEVAPSLGRLVRAMRLDVTVGDDVLQDVEGLLRHYEQAARLRATLRILEEIPELAVVERQSRSYLEEHYADTVR